MRRRGAAGFVQGVDTPSAKLKRAFETLGLVQDECTTEDIRKAYLRLAKKYHPDSTLQADSDQFISVRNRCNSSKSIASILQGLNIMYIRLN